MTSSLTTFREAVTSALSTALGVDFVAGMVDGPIEGRNLGCAWMLGVAEREENVQEEWLDLKVRVFSAWSQIGAPERPFDPALLEEWAETIQTTLKPSITALGPWEARVTGVEFDMEQQGIEVSVLGWQPNPAIMA